MIDRRKLIGSLLSSSLIPFVGCSQRKPHEKAGPTLSRIAFGSCADPYKDQGIWSAMLAREPDIFLFLGDTVYEQKKAVAEFGPIGALERAYVKLNESSEFRRFRSEVDILATWDDHDYGSRDSGVEFVDKEATRKLFLDFWGAPEGDPRRTQEGGLYSAYYYGPPEARIQILLLDTRFNRDQLRAVENGPPKANLGVSGFGPYLPMGDRHTTLLGQKQWDWLEEQFDKPARLRIVGSSIQVLSGFRGWETWSNFPHEREKLFKLIRRKKASGVLLISGDAHYAELSKMEVPRQYPLWDLTSSGMTHFWPRPGPNVNRALDKTIHAKNFGIIHVHWELSDPMVVMEILTESGQVALQKSIRLSDLDFS